MKGVKRTSRENFAGGDAAWEEEKLGTYATSEVRLIEIQEKLCSEVGRGKDQCLTLSETHEALLEDWWFNEQKVSPDLKQWLCVDLLKVCCPAGHFGADCQPCPGFPKVCFGNGKCKGDGTRKGNGACICDAGYTGEYCDACGPGYYQSYKDDDKLLCSKCHPACSGNCTEAGTKGCEACNEGWAMTAENGCVDVNECVLPDVCKHNQFCVNEEGNYSCIECDAACSGCYGDGPDMCIKCAPGYFLQDNFCVVMTARQWAQTSTLTRYLTYFGLCVATCIIFQKNVIVASVIGLAVAVYVSVSEYMLSSINNEPQMLSGLDFNKLFAKT